MNDHQNDIQNAESEQQKGTEKRYTDKESAGKANVKKELTPKEFADVSRKGKLKLAVPILASDVEHTELAFDFGKLNGWDFINAIDGAADAKASAFRLSGKQALALFAAAVEKCNEGIDAEDIKYRMSIDDCIKAVQVASLFFNSTSRAGNLRMLS